MDHLNCLICELRFRLAEGRRGVCGLYESSDDRIVERFADHFLVTCPISIETMPVLHFQPGTKFFQITTTGCNFNCPGCISTVLVREMVPGSLAAGTAYRLNDVREASFMTSYIKQGADSYLITADNEQLNPEEQQK